MQEGAVISFTSHLLFRGVPRSHSRFVNLFCGFLHLPLDCRSGFDPTRRRPCDVRIVPLPFLLSYEPQTWEDSRQFEPREWTARVFNRQVRQYTFRPADMAICNVQPKILLAALLLLAWLAQFVYFFRVQPFDTLFKRSTAENPVLSFQWRDVAPELSGVVKVMNECVEEITSSIHIESMAPLYTCDPSNVESMKEPAQCVADGAQHFENIVSLNSSFMTPAFFAQYDHFENEDRGHGKLAREKCGSSVVDVDREKFQSLLGAKVRVELLDRSPCHSSYSFSLRDSGDSASPTHGGTLIGKTHHFGSISISKHSIWGKRLQDAIVAALGSHKLKYDFAQRNMRGFYWYPPNGFTEWHTDSRQVGGWRLYVVKLMSPGDSGFVLYDSEKRRLQHIRDREGWVNMFRVDPEHPLWHAVFSRDAQRFTVGVAISDNYAELILKRMKR